MVPGWWITVSFLLGRLLFCAVLIFVGYKAAPLYLRCLTRWRANWVPLILLSAMLLAFIAGEFGLGDLLWHTKGGTQFALGLGLSILLAAVLVRSFSRDADQAELGTLLEWSFYRHGPGHWLWPGARRARIEAGAHHRTFRRPAVAADKHLFLNIMSAPLVLLLLARFVLAATASPPVELRLGDWRLVAGLFTGLFAANALLFAAARWPWVTHLPAWPIEGSRFRLVLDRLRESYPGRRRPGARGGGSPCDRRRRIPIACDPHRSDMDVLRSHRDSDRSMAICRRTRLRPVQGFASLWPLD